MLRFNRRHDCLRLEFAIRSFALHVATFQSLRFSALSSKKHPADRLVGWASIATGALSLRPTRSVERGRYARERRRQFGAKPLNDGDDGDGDPCRDQSIFDGRRTRLVF